MSLNDEKRSEEAQPTFQIFQNLFTGEGVADTVFEDSHA